MKELRRIRKERGLTQRGLADASGVDPATISMIETGKRRPHLETLDNLARALDVEVQDLLPKGEPPLFDWAALEMTDEQFSAAVKEAEHERLTALANEMAPYLPRAVRTRSEADEATPRPSRTALLALKRSVEIARESRARAEAKLEDLRALEPA